VIATQNPSYQLGTYPLPESQLDRFMMRVELGYPDPAAEKALLMGHNRREMLQRISPKMSVSVLTSLQQKATQVYISAALADYIQAILQFTRDSRLFVNGLSPRSGIALLNASKAWALIEQREQVLPEDVQAVLASVISHRLQLNNGESIPDIAQHIIRSVPII
jgi:MoxR-like ATPase